MRRTLRQVVPVAAAALGLSACGSTVAMNAAGTAPAGTSGLAVPSATAAPNALPSSGTGLQVPGAPGPGGSLPGPGSALATTGPGGSPLTGPSGTKQFAAPPGSSSESPADGPGITDKAIYVGVTYTVKGDQANAALGATGISQGDTRADAKAVIKEINAHGGVAGRTLVPVWHAYDATSTDTYSDMDQQACADFTQDNHVFAATSTGLTNTFMQCMANAGSMVVNSGTLINYDNAEFAKYPYYFDFGTASQDRVDADEVPSLVRQHYFTGWNTTLGGPSSTTPVKVGVITYDDPNWQDPMRSVLLPALARAGHAPAPQDVITVSSPQRTSDESQIVSQVNQAELKFNQDGVTHVIVLDSSGLLMLFFAEAAHSQRYAPRYGVTSAAGMQAFASGGELDSSELTGAEGLGWFPSIDLPEADGNNYATSATKRCLDVMKKRTGQTFTSTNAASIALSYCDSLFILADAINNAGKVINAGTVRAAFERMRGTEQSALLPSIYFSPTQHDGAEAGFDMYWDPNCGKNGCARYRSQHKL